MIQKLYSEIRSTLKTGDLVAFSGHNFVSANICAITQSNISHVGMIMKVNTAQANLPIIMVVESCKVSAGFSGVHIARLSTRIIGYDGDIWILSVEKSIYTSGVESFLVSKLGVPYDIKQAFGSAFDYPFSEEQEKDLAKIFCSELCNEAYYQNLLTNASNVPSNSSEQTPIDVCRLPIYAEVYQVKGKEKELS